jgi:hypothetical protein
MLGEIDDNFYCSACCYDNGFCLNKTCIVNDNKCEQKRKNCKCYHRKYPTPEQYREEYGARWNGAVYYHCACNECDTECEAKEWGVEEFGCLNDYSVICACTPWGKPPNGWRPK